MISQEPVFIVGFPRSGTTFLQSLLCTQPGMISFPETHFFNKATGHFDLEKKLNETELREAIKVFVDKTQVAFSEQALGQLMHQSMNGLAQKELLEQLLVHLSLKQGEDLHDPNWRWIEKTPSHALYMDKILAMFPKAKFIAIIRNPLNAIDSYYKKLVDYRKPYHDLAEEYRQTYAAIELFQKKHPLAIHHLRYEDLNDNKLKKMRQIMAFLGLTLDADKMNNFAKEAEKLMVSSESWKKGNLNKEHQSTKHDLSLKSILQIEDILGEFFKKYNYPMEKRIMLRLYKMYKRQ